MKYEWKIASVIIAMFIITQLIGLYVLNIYSPATDNLPSGKNITLPYGMQPPEMKPQISLIQIIISFIIAILVFLLLTRLKAKLAIKIWFTFVVYITLAVTLAALLSKISGIDANILALVFAIPLTFFKVIRPNLVVHNATELLIYPGLAAIFVPILRTWSILVLLILISIYDIYAVWKSSLMVNMAKFQIKTLRVFTGFFVPYMRGVDFRKAKRTKGRKVKVSVAILGGGDVAFPLIFAGVILRASGIIPALIVVLFSAIALSLLLLFSHKGKFYPAMPFITSGCIVGWLLTLLL